MFRLGGEAVKVKGAAALTVAVKLAECVRDPLVPRTIIVFEPTGAVLDAAIVKY